MLDEIRLKKFPFTSRFCGRFTCLYVLRLAQEPSLSNQACQDVTDIIFRFKSRKIYKANNVIKNVKCPILFEFRVLSKTFWTRTLGFRTTKFNIVLVRRTSG